MQIQEQINTCREDLIRNIDEEKIVVWLDETMLTTRTYQLTDWAPANNNTVVD